MLDSRFQSPGFRIPQAKKWLDSGIRIPLHGARETVISAPHLIACSIKKHVKAPDLTYMPLYGNVLTNVKIA